MAGNWSRISPFKGLDIPLWSGCHCFQGSLLKAHKIKTWKTKREEFTWGWVPLSSCDYHGILRPSFLIQELIRAVFTMHFQVLKCSGESQGKDRGENPCWTWKARRRGLLQGSRYGHTLSRASSASAMEKEGKMRQCEVRGKRTGCFR